jgi:hypothetical protein
MLAPATGADIPESDLLSDCETIVAAIGKRLGELHATLSHVNDSRHLRERAAEMRASAEELKDNDTAAVIRRLAEVYDRLADRAEIRTDCGLPPSGASGPRTHR